jgi:hypothetical protein
MHTHDSTAPHFFDGFQSFFGGKKVGPFFGRKIKLDVFFRRSRRTRAARFFLVQYTKTGKNKPNKFKLYQMAVK